MKVLHVTNVYPSQSSPDYGVFIKEQIQSLDKLPETQVEVFYIDVQKYGRKAYLLGWWRLRKLARSYDVVHAHHAFSAIVCILAGVHTNLIVSYLSDNFDMIGKLSIFSRMVFRFISAFSSVGITKVKRLEEPGKLVYLPNGVDDKKFYIIKKGAAREILGLKGDHLVLLFVSARSIYRKEKRKDRFDKVVEILNDAGAKVQALYMSDVARELVNSYYNAADCLLLVSDFEGSPNSVKEALASGCPVVSLDVGDVKYLMGGINNTRICDREECLYDDVTLGFIRSLQHLSESDRVNIRDQFIKKSCSQALVANKLLEIYSSI